MDLVERLLQLNCDNKSYGALCYSDKSSAKSKHIDIKFLVINDKVRNHILSVDSESTILNITDSLLKGLSPKVFLEHIAHMGIASHDNILV